MIENKIVWTALPNGFDAQGRPRLSIFVAPRLGTELAASYDPDGPEDPPDLTLHIGKLGNWPDRIQKLLDPASGGAPIKVALELDGITTDPDDPPQYELEVTSANSLNPAAWTALFPSNTQALPFVFHDHSKRLIQSYSASLVVKTVLDAYREVAVSSPTRFPRRDQAGTALKTLLGVAPSKTVQPAGPGADYPYDRFIPDPLPPYLQRRNADITTKLGGANFAGGTDHGLEEKAPTDDEYDRLEGVTTRPERPRAFLRAGLFYRKPGNPLPAYMNSADIPEGPLEDDNKLDFHQILGALGDYPSAQRMLGLVLDCVILNPPDDLNASLGTVKFIAPTSLDSVGLQETPKTGISREFAARSRPYPSDLDESGFLKLGGGQYSVTQLDVDGAALQTLDFSTNMMALEDSVMMQARLRFASPGVEEAEAAAEEAQKTVQEQSLPSLRTGGFSIMRNERSKQLHTNFKWAAILNANLEGGAQEATLSLEDIVRGYRIDVQQKQAGGTWGPWQSLCRRYGTLSLGASNEDDDESLVVARFGDSDTSETRVDRLLDETRHALMGSDLSDTLLDGLDQLLDELKGAFDPEEHVKAHDEGAINAASATGVSKKSTADADDIKKRMYVHETVFGWDGWSLVAPRPGKTISQTDTDPSALQHEPSAHADDVTPGAVRAIVRPAEGTLPRLRFGETYRFRARLVDLAGNGPPPSDESEQHTTEESIYHRYEPVAVPVIVPKAVFTEGESAEVLVIRSEGSKKELGDLEAPAPAITYARDLTEKEKNWKLDNPPHHNVSEVPKLGLPRYAGTAVRWLAPPKTSQTMVEAHGCLDGLLEDGDVRAAYDISTKEKGTFLDGQVDSWIVTPAGVSLSDVKHVGRKAVPPGEGLASGQYVVHVEKPELPYLPDPLADGVSLVMMAADGEPAKHATWSWEGYDKSKPEDFHNIELRSLVVNDKVAGSGEPILEEGADDPTFKLPPATIVEVQLSSTLESSRFEDRTRGPLAMWNMLVDHYEETGIRVSVPPVLGANLSSAVGGGAHWMLTPSRTLTLVHAVQRPVHPPEFIKFTDEFPFQHGERPPGYTLAMFAFGAIWAHGRSTGRVDVTAEWEETVDLTSKRTRPEPETHHGQAFTVPFEYDDTEIGIALTVDPDDLRLLGAQEFGDTKYRRVKYTPVATTRYAQFFPPCITEDPSNLTKTGASIIRDIESTKRPDAPKIISVIPTFTWRASDDGETRTRIGGGLRVYVDRPWYSSGDGERLAVLLRPPAAFGVVGVETEIEFRSATQVSPLNGYVSEWGSDPIWQDSGKLPTLGVDTFLRRSPSYDPATDYRKSAGQLADERKETGAVAHINDSEIVDGVIVDPLGQKDKPIVVTGLNVPALWDAGVDATVNAVAYPPNFDEERQLWYFDIDVDPAKSYFPFIRLALARMQPISHRHSHLSPVVMADFAQLTADRIATATTTVAGKLELTLSGYCGVDVTPLDVAHFSLLSPQTASQTSSLSRAELNQSLVDGPILGAMEEKKWRGHIVRAQLQKLPEGADPDLGWVNEGEEVKLKAWGFPTEAGYASWSGSVPQPADYRGFRWRVLLTESEVFDSDFDVATGIQAEGKLPNITTRRINERVVYADTFEVNRLS